MCFVREICITVIPWEKERRSEFAEFLRYNGQKVGWRPCSIRRWKHVKVLMVSGKK